MRSYVDRESKEHTSELHAHMIIVELEGSQPIHIKERI
jgi:hypothetical protein